MKKPLFEKRHYEFIAKLLQKAPVWVAEEFSVGLSSDNPKFNSSKFLKACQNE